MKILVSNDDGWQADGLVALAAALSEVADITIVAPDRNCSAASSSLTLNVPIRTQLQSPNVYSVVGTPADCVNVALNGLLPFAPDMIVSGINAGPNMGDDVIYSGTIAAAFEARHLKLPAVAVSASANAAGQYFYRDAARAVVDLVKQLRDAPLPSGTVLNVNVPGCSYEAMRAPLVTRLGARARSQKIITQDDPRGVPVYWIGGVGDVVDAAPGTDFHAVQNNTVSITPLDVDMTRYQQLESLQDWLTQTQIVGGAQS